MSIADQAMGTALRGLSRFAQLDVVDRLGLRDPTNRLVYRATRNGFKAANQAGRSFAAAQKATGSGKRQGTRKPRLLFDLTPDDEQQMMVEAFGDFAAEKLRKVASVSDHDCAAPPEVLRQASELGITTLGVPEELGGAVEERSAVTSVLITEALAKGDMGLAVAMLSPAAVSTALGLWGDAGQQATYLGEFTGDDPPAASLAVLEPRPLFDPFELATKATRDGGDYILTGVKSLVPRAAEAELFVIAAAIEGKRPALFIVEAKNDGLLVEAEPAMGIRASATARIKLESARVPATALLAASSPDAYADCVRLGRIAWCALACGTAQAVLEHVRQYVLDRNSFGEPIAYRQSVAFTVSNMAIEAEGMRLATLRAAGLVDQGKEFAREAAIASRLCAVKGMQIGSDGVQMLGGHGYTKEYPEERWYRDLRAAGVMEGALLV